MSALRLFWHSPPQQAHEDLQLALLASISNIGQGRGRSGLVRETLKDCVIQVDILTRAHQGIVEGIVERDFNGDVVAERCAGREDTIAHGM